jgi:hypothetical protein
MTRILGVDIGGVIIDRINDDTDTSFFSENFLQTSEVPGVFEALAALYPLFEQVHIVSKCGPRIQQRSLEWLEHKQLTALTGISFDNIHFCRKRHEKDGICQSLGITHFVDDRLEVLSYLTTVQHRILFRPSEDEVRQYKASLPTVKVVQSWTEALRALT